MVIDSDDGNICEGNRGVIMVTCIRVIKEDILRQ